MEVRWTEEASRLLENTLDYWTERNKSPNYALKILEQVEWVEKSISENPYFLARFLKNVKLYQRHFFNSKFALYYDIVDEESMIIIKLFRSNKQEPL